MSARSRRAGILLPLFSIASTRSWGIGEIGDLTPTTRWLAAAGQRLLQLLPINEMPPHETSPYSALSAMAIDPQFVSLQDLEDFAVIGGEGALGAEERAQLEAARQSPVVAYSVVRSLKSAVLRRCFESFRDREWANGNPPASRGRAGAMRAYCEQQAWWLDEYSLFRAIHASQDERAWTEWPEALRRRDPQALAAAREELADDILFRQYLQWVAGEQWARARAAAGDVALFGDVPFMVSGDSADVWARQDQFRLDASVGVPPDAFSATGQDWGLPVYRWDVCAANDFEWLRQRARRNSALFDGYRIDHLVGFYRTYFRPHDGGDPRFTPAEQAEQIRLGEQVLAVFRSAGAEITAEDLGVVPDFVRESLARLDIPGYKVFRWEREWDREGQPFRDPRGYAARSVATSGTHDTEPMATWWEMAPPVEREGVLAIPPIAERLAGEDGRALAGAAHMPSAVRDAILGALNASGSDVLIVPMQDAFGWRDRVNQPATVNNGNWTWKLPWPSDRLTDEFEAMSVAARLKEWATRNGR